MKRLLSFLLLSLALPALAIDIGAMPNPSAYVPGFGSEGNHFNGTLQYFTTTGDKQVCTGTCFMGYVGNATGTTITITLYDDGDATCSSGQKTGVITLTNSAQPLYLPGKYSNGICMTVAGTNPTVTVSTLP
jgi:hypothetical protein